MERKNRTYALIEDSDSDGEASKQGGKDKKRKEDKEKDKGKKRKHLRQKRDESPLSSEEDKKKRWVLAYLGLLMKNDIINGKYVEIMEKFLIRTCYG